MFISILKWQQSDGDDDNWITHSVLYPSWDDIWDAFARLDGQTYPALSLQGDDESVSQPLLSVLGGPDEYSVTLENVPTNGGVTSKRLVLINPDRFNDFHSFGWRGIGKGYHNYEVEIEYLIPEKDLVQRIVQYFTETGRWYPAAPHITETVDENGEWRQNKA
jgi:hypothetical protein